jgi:hypothetical protein
MSMQEMAGVWSSRETCGGQRVPTMNSAIPRVLEHNKKGVSFREWS